MGFLRATAVSGPGLGVALLFAACGLSPGGLDVVSAGDASPDASVDVGAGDTVPSVDHYVATDSSAEDTGAVDTGTDTACSDTSSDPHNCGTCGHDCQGESCAGGLCQPETLATLLGSVNAVRVANDTVYFTTGVGGQVASCPAGGGTPTTLVNVAPNQPFGLALDAQNFYATDFLSGNMLTCPLAGCGGPPQTGTAAGGGQGNGIFVTSGAVYWVDSAGAGGGSVWTSQLGGQQPKTIDMNVDHPADILGVGQQLFWTVENVNHIDACTLPCANITQGFITNLSNPLYLASDGTNLFITEDGTGTGAGLLQEVPIAGGAPVTIAEGLQSPRGVTFDGGYVYWANNVSPGGVIRCAAGALCTNPTVLAGGLNLPFAVATDANYVYWGEQGGGGTLKRVAK